MCPCQPKRERQHEKVYDDKRGSAWSRGYDKHWQRFRKWFLDQHPVCEDCGKSANEVHHKVKVRDDRSKRLDPANCMALCKTCHSIRTNRGE